MESITETMTLLGVGGFILLTLAMYVMAIIKVHKRHFASLREKSMWLTIVVLAPLIGSMIFLLWDARTKRTAFAKMGR